MDEARSSPYGPRGSAAATRLVFLAVGLTALAWLAVELLPALGSPRTRVKLAVVDFVDRESHVPPRTTRLVDPWGQHMAPTWDAEGRLVRLRSAGPNGVDELGQGDDIDVPSLTRSGPLWMHVGARGGACGCPLCALEREDILALLVPRALATLVLVAGAILAIARVVPPWPVPRERMLVAGASCAAGAAFVALFATTARFGYPITSILFPDWSPLALMVGSFVGSALAFLPIVALVRPSAEPVQI